MVLREESFCTDNLMIEDKGRVDRIQQRLAARGAVATFDVHPDRITGLPVNRAMLVLGDGSTVCIEKLLGLLAMWVLVAKLAGVADG